MNNTETGSDALLFEYSDGEMRGYCPHCNVYLCVEVDNEEIIEALDRGESVTIVYESCRACKGLIVLIDRKRKELQKEVIYPKHSVWEALPSEVPLVYQREYYQAVGTLRPSPKASASLIRGLLALVLHQHYQINHGNLAREVKDLISRSDIPSYIQDDLDRFRRMGNLAAHPVVDGDTGNLVEVEPWEASWLLGMMWAFLDFSFVQPAKQKERGERLDEKAGLSEKLGKERKK